MSRVLSAGVDLALGMKGSYRGGQRALRLTYRQRIKEIPSRTGSPAIGCGTVSKNTERTGSIKLMSNSPSKITFIGAGSTVFAKRLIGDILSFPELANSKICLHDIDVNRLKTSEIVARRITQTLGAQSTVEVTTDRSRAFDGATYAINMIQVGGYRPCTVTDFEIPEALRSAPDHCGYFGHRRDNASSAYHSRAHRYVQGHGTNLSKRCPFELRQSDGDELLGSQ